MRESVQKVARFVVGFDRLFAPADLQALADTAGVIVIFQRPVGGSSGFVGVQKVTPPYSFGGKRSFGRSVWSTSSVIRQLPLS